MKGYYVVPQKGTGSEDDMFLPDIPSGYSGWVVCTDVPVQPPTPQTWIVLVSGEDAYHAALKVNPNVLWLADVEDEDATP